MNLHLFSALFARFSPAKICAPLCSPVVGAALVLAGCASHPINPNPPSPVAGTGYVDFYCDTASDLSWDVLRFDRKTGKMIPGFSEYKPVPGNVLRVPAPPGTQQFQIGIFNKVNDGPEKVSVQVEDGKVTPVKVDLEHAGSLTVNRKFRDPRKGFGRAKTTVPEENNAVEIVAKAQTPQPYQTKEQMPYFRTEAKQGAEQWQSLDRTFASLCHFSSFFEDVLTLFHHSEN